MKIKRIVKAAIGIIQSLTAFSALFFACCLHFNLFNVQTSLGSALQLLYLHVTILLIFGFLSLINGVILIFDSFEVK